MGESWVSYFKLSETSSDDEEVDIMYRSLVPGSVASFCLQQKQVCFFLSMMSFYYQPTKNLQLQTSKHTKFITQEHEFS